MTLEEFFRKYNIPQAPAGHHHRTTGFLQTDCPYCSPNSQKWRLGCNVRFLYCNCWTCGPKSLVDSLHTITGLSHREIRSSIENCKGEVSTSNTPRRRLILPKGVNDLLYWHRRYLQNRGFDPDNIVRLWGVGGIGIAARLKWRLFIPIVRMGTTVSWTTRSTSPFRREVLGNRNYLRYISAKTSEEVISHKDVLYGEDYVRHTLIVVEGPLDVWSIGPGAVCTFGTGFSKAQLLRLSQFPKRYICYDSEPNAQKRAKQLCELLAPFDGNTWNLTLDSKDAAEASPKEIKQLRRLLK